MRKHHRKPKSRGGGDSKRNKVKVKPRKHRAWHILFSNKTPHAICEEINKTWLDPDFIIECRPRDCAT